MENELIASGLVLLAVSAVLVSQLTARLPW